LSQIVGAAVEAYAEVHTTPAAAHLAGLAAETRATQECPQMLTGPVEGRLLETLIALAQPRLVVELGTYSGYSALSMAGGLPPGGRIISCELDPERAAFARRHIAAAGQADRVEVVVGPALETLSGLNEPLDLVFIDADKGGYVGYYEAIVPRLAPDGLIVADNTLQSGRVADPADDGETTEHIRAFNTHVAADPRTVQVLLTVRDGVTLIRRTEGGFGPLS